MASSARHSLSDRKTQSFGVCSHSEGERKWLPHKALDALRSSSSSSLKSKPKMKETTSQITIVGGDHSKESLAALMKRSLRMMDKLGRTDAKLVHEHVWSAVFFSEEPGLEALSKQWPDTGSEGKISVSRPTCTPTWTGFAGMLMKSEKVAVLGRRFVKLSCHRLVFHEIQDDKTKAPTHRIYCKNQYI